MQKSDVTCYFIALTNHWLNLYKWGRLLTLTTYCWIGKKHLLLLIAQILNFAVNSICIDSFTPSARKANYVP